MSTGAGEHFACIVYSSLYQRQQIGHLHVPLSLFIAEATTRIPVFITGIQPFIEPEATSNNDVSNGSVSSDLK